MLTISVLAVALVGCGGASTPTAKTRRDPHAQALERWMTSEATDPTRRLFAGTVQVKHAACHAYHRAAHAADYRCRLAIEQSGTPEVVTVNGGWAKGTGLYADWEHARVVAGSRTTPISAVAPGPDSCEQADAAGMKFVKDVERFTKGGRVAGATPLSGDLGAFAQSLRGLESQATPSQIAKLKVGAGALTQMEGETGLLISLALGSQPVKGLPQLIGQVCNGS